MRCAWVVLGWVVVCAACTYETRVVPGEPSLNGSAPVVGGVVPIAPEAVAVRQCTSEADCDGPQKCELIGECFRTCVGDDCDSGCTGVCRGHGGKCHKTPMPNPTSCEGRWHVAWDEEGCPRPPVCLCPDGSPQPAQGGCATTCTPPICAEGQALIPAADCYGGCATACSGDNDCQGGERCLRKDGCALVVCPPGPEGKDCRDGQECFGVCVAGT